MKTPTGKFQWKEKEDVDIAEGSIAFHAYSIFSSKATSATTPRKYLVLQQQWQENRVIGPRKDHAFKLETWWEDVPIEEEG